MKIHEIVDIYAESRIKEIPNEPIDGHGDANLMLRA
jgi:hypothetical protein